LKGTLPSNKNFPGGERLILFLVGLFSLVEETHVSLEKNPFILDSGASGTLFSCENFVSFGKSTASSFGVSR
jgi:hypothetical protein